jgi:hypothetical protein
MRALKIYRIFIGGFSKRQINCWLATSYFKIIAAFITITRNFR